MGVKDMSSIIVVADGFLDYKLGNPSTTEFKNNKSRGKNRKDNCTKFKQKTDDSQCKTIQTNKGCFICDGLHRAKDCPKHEVLDTIVDVTPRNSAYADQRHVTGRQPSYLRPTYIKLVYHLCIIICNDT